MSISCVPNSQLCHIMPLLRLGSFIFTSAWKSYFKNSTFCQENEIVFLWGLWTAICYILLHGSINILHFVLSGLLKLPPGRSVFSKVSLLQEKLVNQLLSPVDKQAQRCLHM